MRYLVCLCFFVVVPVQAATIYLCEAYGGGTFFTSGVCSHQKSMAIRMFNVPDLPFQQQVDIAKQQMVPVQQSLTVNQVQTSNDNCGALSKERRAIDQITEKMIWVPIEQQNANYHRMNQIKADMARLGCRY